MKPQHYKGPRQTFAITRFRYVRSMFLYTCLILLLLGQRISTSLYGYFTVVEFKKPLYLYFIFIRTVSLLFQKKEQINGPLLSSKNPHLHDEAKSSTFLVKMIFICMRIKNHFHIKGWALNLFLIQRSWELGNWLLF